MREVLVDDGLCSAIDREDDAPAHAEDGRLKCWGTFVRRQSGRIGSVVLIAFKRYVARFSCSTRRFFYLLPRAGGG